jgi:acyl-CoA synthetase (AMP-forming)/AMP-acid ligase II
MHNPGSQNPGTRYNIGTFVSKRAHLNPTTEAVVDLTSGTRLTHPELNERCNRVAHALGDSGHETGDRVATLLLNGSEFVESFFGIAKAGCVTVALNWRLVADELSFILTDSGARTLVFGTAFNDVVTDLHSRGTDGTRVSRWVHVGHPSERPDFAEDYEGLVRRADDHEPETTAGDDDLLFIMYTSGTTGLPKGVMHTHDTALWSVLTTNATADMRYDDVYLINLPLFHVGALNPLLDVTHRGATAVIMGEFDPVRMWEAFDEESVIVTLAVPAALQFMLATYDAEQHRHESLRWIMSGAAPVPESLIKTYEAMNIEIHQVYGLTETCGPACLISPQDALAHAGSTGKAFFHTESGLSTPKETTSGWTSPARCSSADPMSWSDTGTGPSRRPKPSLTAGCTQGTWPPWMPTGSSTSRTGSRT